MFERLLEEERRFEVRLRRTALISWTLAFACLFSLTTLVAFAGGIPLNDRVELADLALMIAAPIGSVALLAAIATSLAWLFRSRTPTLRAISRRLEALERQLSEG